MSMPIVHTWFTHSTSVITAGYPQTIPNLTKGWCHRSQHFFKTGKGWKPGSVPLSWGCSCPGSFRRTTWIDCIPILGDGHQSVHRDRTAQYVWIPNMGSMTRNHKKHKHPYAMFWPQHISCRISMTYVHGVCSSRYIIISWYTLQ